VKCMNTADVIAAVNFARTHQLVVAVRGQGHSVAGHGTCDDGLVIDLSGMRGTRVDPHRQTIRVEGGCNLGDLDHATHAFGLATSSGIASVTGLSGLTLGGGFGHLNRKCGLACDNLISADVVTADGQFLVASADNEHADLFWALRGGGGNFGVVTSFEFKLYPINTVYGGPMFWPIEMAEEGLCFFRDLMAQAPTDLNVIFGFITLQPEPVLPPELHYKKVFAAALCYAGPLDEAEEVFAPIRQFGPPMIDQAGPMPYPALQSMFDELFPDNLFHYWKSDFIADLPDEAIKLHVAHGTQLPSPLAAVHFYSMGGAIQNLQDDETPFSHRSAKFMHAIVGTTDNLDDIKAQKTWARNYWSAARPYAMGGAYINIAMEDTEDPVEPVYNKNYQRLVEVKSLACCWQTGDCGFLRHLPLRTAQLRPAKPRLGDL
ncbi:MAG: FAD-binding oxidoreductase, partial [Okeania sp. SIO3B3]|nr:FAD-binding oxidoreductase [Okeania sp. SIO3B3]